MNPKEELSNFDWDMERLTKTRESFFENITRIYPDYTSTQREYTLDEERKEKEYEREERELEEMSDAQFYNYSKHCMRRAW